jgi:DNA-binding NarL/FixJ family response regulator
MAGRGNSQSKDGRRGVYVFSRDPKMRRWVERQIDHETNLMVLNSTEAATEPLSDPALNETDLVLIEISENQDQHLQLIRQIRKLHGDLPVLVISIHGDIQKAKEAIAAGAHGYLTRTQAADNLLFAVRCVLKGEYFLTGQILAHIIQEVFHEKVAEDPAQSEKLREFAENLSK